MKVIEALGNMKKVHFPADSPPVVRESVEALLERLPAARLQARAVKKTWPDERAFRVAVAPPSQLKYLGIKKPLRVKKRFIYFLLRKSGSGYLVSSHPGYLFSFVHYLTGYLAERNVDYYHCGRWIVPSFAWQRICYDYFLTQQGRIQAGLNRETYIRELAALGFTHVEVNGLAFPMGLETGPRGEAYPMFYTYCPALDQFVSSSLNRGLYPGYYLSANLQYLKQNARLAIRFGLTPGLLCFEPRSVPERFFQKYPMLRGARVDHPFRSFTPRYNMTIAHPVVREHYAEMLRKLMQEVPELGFISIWTNDSGAGFEHTRSLYVGRNGGAYLIREWKDDEEIARLAGENALRFFRVLRDEARRINPGFRVITRMESFYGEHDTVWNGLEDGIEVETTSLWARGWDMPYTHPRYPDSHAINAGTVYQMDFDARENILLNELAVKRSMAHYYFSAGPHSLFDPLLGVPYPVLTYQRIKTLHDNQVGFVAHTGGIPPPGLVPWNINHEVVRAFQYDPELDIHTFLERMALRWAGKMLAPALLEAWKHTEEAIMAFPNVTPLYSTFGFTWYRLWARPFVPDIEAIPGEQRRYYEDFMCTTPHNPNNVDLSRDVLFRLTTPEKSTEDVDRIDRNVWDPVEAAIQALEKVNAEALKILGEENIIRDQLVRIRALKCWMMTQRNVAAWIAGVYGFMHTAGKKTKAGHKSEVKKLIRKEIENSRQLRELLDSGIEFMAMTDQGETPLIYGKNLKELLSIRIRLMEEHLEDDPFIDHGYMEKRSGEIIA